MRKNNVKKNNVSWDYWYFFDKTKNIFHVFYLNADKALFCKHLHHENAQVGYATTPDFIRFAKVNDCVFKANDWGWDNSSIWTGDIVKIANGFLLFYTSRDRKEDDGFTQNIGIAYSKNLTSWERIPDLRIKPDPRFYEIRTIEKDTSIHAWRDPFVFKHNNTAYMILAAKSKLLPIGSKAAIGLLRANLNDLTQWESLPPLFAPGWYSEMEVPQIYYHGENRLSLVYSTSESGDNSPFTNGVGGFQAVNFNIKKAFTDRSPESATPEVLLPYSSAVYASRVVSELDGSIIGFDLKNGGFRNSGITRDWQSPDKYFGLYEYRSL
jgi:beta-fructofuranosidase